MIWQLHEFVNATKAPYDRVYVRRCHHMLLTNDSGLSLIKRPCGTFYHVKADPQVKSQAI